MKNEVKVIEEVVTEGNNKKGKIAVIAGVAAAALAGIGFGIYKVVTGKKTNSEDEVTEVNE